MLFWIVIGIDVLVWAWVIKMEFDTHKRRKAWASDPRNPRNRKNGRG